MTRPSPLPPTLALALTGLLAACGSEPAPSPVPAEARLARHAGPDPGLVAHGEYIVRLGGCNDCHTADDAASGGQVPKERWLTGSPLGYLGPWGTSYATNLRLTIAGLDETQWLDYTATLHTRPIMPDFMLREMRELDRRAIWHFVRSLGPAGDPAPKALPPGQTPPPPYYQLVLPLPDAAQPSRDPAEQGQDT